MTETEEEYQRRASEAAREWLASQNSFEQADEVAAHMGGQAWTRANPPPEVLAMREALTRIKLETGSADYKYALNRCWHHAEAAIAAYDAAVKGGK